MSDVPLIIFYVINITFLFLYFNTVT